VARILLVTYFFPPSSQIGAQRPGRMARGLPKHGFDVDVVCASTDRAIGGADPTQTSLVPTSGRIMRVPTPFVLGRHPYESLKGNSGLERGWWKARAYVELLLLTRDWAWKWGVHALASVREELPRYDALVVNGPPFEGLVPFIREAERIRLPVVWDLRDLWQARPQSTGPLGWFSPKERRERWIHGLRDEMIRGADHVVLTSDGAAELLHRTFPGVDRARVSVITNAYAEVDEPKHADTSPDGDPQVPRSITLCHSGLLSYGRDRLAMDLIRGLGVLKRRKGPSITLRLTGQAVPDVDAAAKAEGVDDQVEVLGWVDREKAREIQRDSDALLLLQPAHEAGIAIPGKLFEYMGRRRPVLAFMPEGAATRLVRDHDLGAVISSEDPEAIANGLADFAAQVRRRPVLPPPPEMFSESQTVERLAEIIHQVIGRASPSD